MPAQLLNGKLLAAEIRSEIKQEITAALQSGMRAPGLAVILVGEDPASHIYVRNKRQACEDVGIKSFYFPLPASIPEPELIAQIELLNNNPDVDGILLQLPLPRHIHSGHVLEKIHPDKDVDGFHPYNLGRLAQRRPFLRPCTPHGIMVLLHSINQIFKGKHAVIVGASNIVGRPMALELLIAGATITVCHRFTHDLAKYVREADLLIAAAGKPELIKGEWIKEGATVVDVGSPKGDVEFEAAKERAAWITPVPGGVGPMTVAMLLKNSQFAATLHQEERIKNL